jgi:hypothetical protein
MNFAVKLDSDWFAILFVFKLDPPYYARSTAWVHYHSTHRKGGKHLGTFDPPQLQCGAKRVMMDLPICELDSDRLDLLVLRVDELDDATATARVHYHRSHGKGSKSFGMLRRPQLIFCLRLT